MSDAIARALASLDEDLIVPTTEAITRFETPSPTAVVEPIRDWAQAHDLCLSWQTMAQSHLSQMHVLGVHPVVYADIDDEFKDRIPDRLLFLSDDGLIQSGNAVLCCQAADLRARYFQSVAKSTERQEGAVAESSLAGLPGVHTPDWADTSKAGNIR